ncbi:MAG TPA: DNA/RNA non-specific endonuclease [Noviherbaspirillum sp.]|uniref:DNA/RNA non-specific endonuclease n=1 Tax=Noviherbaspirillum sp. TaxID=1926288 RepID=UPI002F920F5A
MRKTKDDAASYLSLPPTELRIRSVLRSRKMRDAVAAAASRHELSHRRKLGFSADVVAEHLSSSPPASDEAFFDRRQLSEAIVLIAGRPVLLVKDGVFETASLDELEQQLAPHRKALAAPIRAVGRIELSDHDTFEWCGTGWRIEEDLIVTNRHVANVFAQRQGRVFRFRVNQRGRQVRARIDFREEYRGLESEESAVAEILWIADDTAEAPDMAILRLLNDPSLPPPIRLLGKPLEPEQRIAVVGYPARDSRNDAGAMREIFGDIYDVKRFAPGEVVAVPPSDWYFTHDSSTLGGNSGSAIIDIESKSVAGLHFGGQFRKTNYAVKASVIRSLLARRSWVPVSRQELHVPEEGFSEKKRSVGYMRKRGGYDPRFLGVQVPLPKPGRSHRVLETNGEPALPYMHFSIVMSETRRLPILTAVNIDGGLKHRLKRQDAWGFDPRIPRQKQIGHGEFYGPAAFDKGHMVRREDPGWGRTQAEAALGEEDSFVYTNAVPQMPQLNQRSWLALEDYVLDNAKTQGFRVSVFTGPVFRGSDPQYEAVQVPLDFWKVVAMIDADTGGLCVSAYMLSQEGMLPEEGFRYGPYKTWQVPLQKVADEADLKFSRAMTDADVFGGAGMEERIAAGRFVEILSAHDVVLVRPRTRRR